MGTADAIGSDLLDLLSSLPEVLHEHVDLQKEDMDKGMQFNQTCEKQ